MDYLVSVVIPIYNCEKYIERAVESVINQNNSHRYQIILVDDGSKDGSGRICDELQKKYDNVFAFHQENAGVSAARNLGIEKSVGEWISFVDCDDYLLDGFYDSLLEGETADLLCCGFCTNDRYSSLIGEQIKEGVYQKSEFADVLYPLMTQPGVFYTVWNKLYRNDIVKNNNLRFVVGMKLAEDMTFVYEYVRYIESFKFVNKNLYFYYMNEGSASHVVSRSYETFKSIFLYHSDYFKNMDCDGAIHKKLQTCFVMNAVDSIEVAVLNLKFNEAVEYIKTILNDELFQSNYFECPVCQGAGGIYKIVERYVFKKQPFMVCLMFKLNFLRQKIISKL